MERNEEEKPLLAECPEKCPECGSKELALDPQHAELFCYHCGLVILEGIVDQGPEWRVFDWEQTSRIRTGPPSSLRIHDRGLGTKVTFIPGSPGSYKLKKWQQRICIANSKERTFVFALGEMDRMASVLKLPNNMREDASLLYREAMRKHLIRGRSVEDITTAILFITCRQNGVPRTLREIANISRAKSPKMINRTIKYLVEELAIKIEKETPSHFVPRFCSKLELDSHVQSTALEIIEIAEEQGMTNGRGPIGIAAAAIYMAAMLCGNHRTQKEMSDVTGVTEVTIRNRYKEISKQLQVDVITTEKHNLKLDLVTNNTADSPLFQSLKEISSELQLNSEMISFTKYIAEEAEKNGFLRIFGIEELVAGILCYTADIYDIETNDLRKRIANITNTKRMRIRHIEALIIKIIEKGNQPLLFL